jgi:hypothetical protein
MRIGVFGKRGLAGFNILLMVFAVISIAYSVGIVSGATFANRDGMGALAATHSNTLTGGGAIDSVTGGKAGLDTAADAVVANKDSMFADLLELDAGSGYSALASGVQWAVIAYFAGTMIGDMFGMTEKNSEALGTSLAAAFGTYKALSVYGQTGMFSSGSTFGWIGAHPGLTGLGIGVVVFVAMYKEEKTKVVTFDCMPWQAPTGGDNCEICNDPYLPCSEYRCKSLGQSCEIVNTGTADEKCVYVNPGDVNPPIIRPDYDKLSAGHQYKNVRNSPPGPGFEIVNTASRDGCLKAFSPLEFGIITDEPAQCKIDFVSTKSYEDMVAYFGGSNLYDYNHSEKFSLPGAKELSGSGFSLTNGKDLTFFIRCQDKNGNTNEAEYALEFCVDQSPDTTAPRIEATSILNGGCVVENTDKAEVVFYVNEPSSCRWSFQDKDYDMMENSMSCSSSYSHVNALQLFGCKSSLSGIPRDGVTYYVRCKDRSYDKGSESGGVSGGNVMRESFRFSLRGSTGLVLKNLKPSSTVYGGVSPAPIELYAETLYGCNNGRAICQWSSDGKNYIEFFDTNKEDGIHTQRLDLVDGIHKYNVRCIDEGGNLVEDVVSFEVYIDTSAPVIARVYEQDGMLKIITIRNSECSYSLSNCDFSFVDGIEMPYANTEVHVADWSEDNTYYIKCRDEFLNENADCSIIVRPTENFL